MDIDDVLDKLIETSKDLGYEEQKRKATEARASVLYSAMSHYRDRLETIVSEDATVDKDKVVKDVLTMMGRVIEAQNRG